MNYIDDDWSGSWTTAGLDSIYDIVVVVDHPETTIAEHYARQLSDGYEWIGVCAHSNSHMHGFLFNQSQHWSWFSNYQLKALDPPALFYNLFACSNARYVESDYMGGWYIFADTYGLAAIGSTKTGSMLHFQEFYYPLGRGSCLGAAFLDWFLAIAQNGFDQGEIDWFYGMTLLGDPTLRPHLTTHYYLTIQAESGGGVYPPSGYWEADQVVRIRAVPDPGYDFIGWLGTGQGSYTGKSNPACVGIKDFITEKACFHPVESSVYTEGESAVTAPTILQLAEVFPNPFNTQTVIRYVLPRKGQVFLRVYSVLGQLVKELENGEKAEGCHQTAWDGTDANGQQVGSGIYFLCLAAGGHRKMTKLVYMK
jgi:hypothetical protein